MNFLTGEIPSSGSLVNFNETSWVIFLCFIQDRIYLIRNPLHSPMSSNTFSFSWIPTEFDFDNVASLGTLVYVGSRLTQRAKMHFNHHQMLLSHLQVLDVFFNIILTAVFRIILCLFIYWYQCGTVVCLCSSRLHAPGSFEFCKLICLTLLFF